MSSTQVSTERQPATGVPNSATVDLKLEVIPIPVSDVDRAKAILFHPLSRSILDAFMIGVNEVVSGANTAKVAMTNAAAKANAAIRG